MAKTVVELPAPKAPTPAKVDKLIEAYHALLVEVETAQEALNIRAEGLAPLKAELLDLVERFGYQHSEKTKRLAGVSHAAKSTIGVRIQVVDAEVAKLWDESKACRVRGLRHKLFSVRSVYQLVKNPADVLRGLSLAPELFQHLDTAIRRCFESKTNKPSLTLDYAEIEEAA